MFPSSNAPPPPTYSGATNYSLGNQYNTQYSDPIAANNVQPQQPLPISQPQGFNLPPYPIQQQPVPFPMGATNSPLYPVGNQQNMTTLPGQTQGFGQPPIPRKQPQGFGQPPISRQQPQGFGQPPIPRQQPPPIGPSPYTVGNQRNRTSLAGQQQMFPETKRQELQRQAIIAMVCFFPLGYWAWIEY